MEKNINIKKESTIMGKILLMFTILFVLISSVNSVPDELLRYQFEEGSGSIILDSSGFGNNAVVNAGTWTTGVFGTYQFLFDGVDDWFTTVTSSDIPNNMTISFFMRASSTGTDNVWSIYDTNDNINFLAKPNTAGNNIEITYLNTTGSLVTVTLMNTAFSQSTSFHVVLAFDFDAQNVDFYWNGVKTSHALPSPVSRTSIANVLRVGADSGGTNDFTGYIDEFRIYNFIVNQTQVDDLRLNNHIDIPVIPDNGTGGVNVTLPTTIISGITPINNSNVTNAVNFQINLLTSAQCDLYIDNQLHTSLSEAIAHSFDIILDIGAHEYFIYCNYIINTTKYYEISETFYFNVDPLPPNDIVLTFSGTDFDVNSENFYLTSPCLKEGISTKLDSDLGPYRPIYNPQGAYFSKVVNGVGTLTLPIDDHEICLLHGLIDYNSTNKTTGYSINSVDNYINLGKFNVPQGLITYYTISLDQFDIYGKTNPKAWGQTWPSIVTGLILFIIGLLILITSTKSGSAQGTVIGGIMIIISLGFEINGIIGILVGV